MTADNLNNVRVIPDLLVINENVRPSKVAYRQFNDKSKTWIGVRTDAPEIEQRTTI